MKRHTAMLVEAAMLLTVAWMSGCTDQEENSSSRLLETTAALTTALPESDLPQTETAAGSGGTTAGNGQDNLTFDSYDAFLTAMGEYYPGTVLVAPAQIASGEWTVSSIYLLTSGEAPFYYYAFTTPEGQNLMLTVSQDEQFRSMEALQQQLEADASIEPEPAYSGSNWIIGRFAENGMYVLYGLTGDESVYYSLAGADAQGETLTPDVLQTLRETMRL